MKDTTTGQTLLTIREARATYFKDKVSRSTLYRLYHEGELRGIQVGKKILLERAGIEQYLARQQEQEGKRPRGGSSRAPEATSWKEGFRHFP